MGTDAVSVHAWQAQFDQMIDRIGGCFGRCDLRERAEDYVQGLLGPVQRKNSGQMAEYLGDEKPYGVQRLLGRARWNADAVREVLVRYAAEHLLEEGEGGLLIVDETGFLKKGSKSVGVQRQYSGTAGRIANCQIGVFLALAGARERALIDRELYLPECWCQDAARRKEAGVPKKRSFATKPQLAQRMLDRAGAAGLKLQWVLADEVYGNDSKFCRHLESHGQPYVVAVGSQQRLWVELQQQRVDTIADAIPPHRWFRFSVADGAKGPRRYDWAAGRLTQADAQGLVKWLLVRRSLEDPRERAYYLCLAPAQAKAEDLAVAAGGRWAIESCFEAAKQETGLDEYEVRSWAGWHRHLTLSMLALAFLAVVRARAKEPEPEKKGRAKKGRIWCR